MSAIWLLLMANNANCIPPFNDREELRISRGFLKELQERFCLI